MKRFIFFARVYALLLLGIPKVLFAQDSLQSYPNYVVIGAFAYEENAIQFTAEANTNKFPAKFEINPNRNLFYVYVLSTGDRAFAFDQARKLRTDTKYFDTWVYNGVLGAGSPIISGNGSSQDLNPETGGQINAVRVDEQSVGPDNNTEELSHVNGAPLAGLSADGNNPTVQQPVVVEDKTKAEGGRKNKRKNSSPGDRETDQSIASAAQNQPNGEKTTGLNGENNNQIANNQVSNPLLTTATAGGNQALVSAETAAVPQLQSSSNDNAKASRRNSRKAAKQNSGETTGQATDLIAGETNGLLPGQTSAQKLAQAPGQEPALASNETTGLTAGQTPGQTDKSKAGANKQTTGQAGKQTTAGQTQGQSTAQPSQQTKGQTSAQDASLTSNETTGLTPGQTSGQTADKSKAAANKQSTGQAGKQTTAGQTQGQSTAQPSQQTKGQTSAQDASLASNEATGLTPRKTSGQTTETDKTKTEKQTTDATVAKNAASTETQGTPEEKKTDAEIAARSITEKTAAEQRAKIASLGPPPKPATTEPLKPEEVVGKNFYFHVFRADNHDMIDGEVDAIDFEKSRKMATYQGNSSVKVMMPAGKTKQISFVCEVFGYRKQQREFDPAAPAGDLYLDDKGNLVVPFELARLQKGDIAIMYNVFFFKDAAVMRPESRYEVNNLLELLVENPSYKIRIHGHTNGNASGKIIRMNKAGNYYSLSETKQGFGSAKELSEERAVVMRDFLVNSGIPAERMDVKAWGGKKPIHDKNSVRANENVRVEIEILSQ